MSRRNKAVPKIASPDRKLDPAQFLQLNTQFYEGFHQELVMGRLGILCAMHETPEVIENLLAGGVIWGRLRMKVEPDEELRETLQRNAELELVALHHHAGEMLFRVFWVHAHGEPCPWLALARLRNPGDLKTAAEKYLHGQLWTDQGDRLRGHAAAVWGSSAVDSEGVIHESLAASVDAVAQWIETAARTVLDAPLYNAYKHGMAVVAGNPFTMSMGDPSSPASVALDAPAGFKYVDRGLDEASRRYYWQLVREPVDFAATVAEVGVFGSLLGVILDAGAFDRHVTHAPRRSKY